MDLQAKALDWTQNLPQGLDADSLYDTFKVKAEALTVKVIRCVGPKEAAMAIAKEIKDNNFKKVVSAPLTRIDINVLKDQLEQTSVEFVTDLTRDVVEQADLGISEFDLAIADLGALVQDAADLYKRLVSTLPPTHLAVISSKSLVKTFEESLEVIQKTYGSDLPAFIAYVTGPSKTADIERVLTIGVHGPGRLIVVCVD
ncbi:MAG: lactate utilization protein [Bacillota bacterium]